MNSEEKDPLAMSEDESAATASKPVVPVAVPVAKKLKRKRKKLPRDGPKPIQTGYVRYMNEKRDIIRSQFPDVPIGEITRKLAQGWASLTDEEKKPYLEAAEQDKNRFSREMEEYRQNQAKKVALAEEAPKIVVEKPAPQETFEHKNGDYDIPIFTDEFLDHNKTVETELRALRKSFTDYEQQNSVLEKHVENMRNGINKLTNETTQMMANNKVLQAYLEKMRSKLVNAMGSLPAASGSEHNITMDTIDDFLQNLPSAHGPATLNKAKDIIRKLDLNIQV
ncbi:high mobility group protein 20A [Lutzomyia longipalpis]|uniref:Putative hmg box-containing protein n=1 Tax=Lutzomyia longipalpis TaxID=7200 RepID=A0A1B0GIJ0_LUTLO|nr:high mobility group protein 20A [Lutzomyia longipalpis]